MLAFTIGTEQFEIQISRGDIAEDARSDIPALRRYINGEAVSFEEFKRRSHDALARERGAPT